VVLPGKIFLPGCPYCLMSTLLRICLTVYSKVPKVALGSLFFASERMEAQCSSTRGPPHEMTTV